MMSEMHVMIQEIITRFLGSNADIVQTVCN